MRFVSSGANVLMSNSAYLRIIKNALIKQESGFMRFISRMVKKVPLIRTSKDKASFLVQILKIQMVNRSISMFFMSSIPQKGKYQDYEFTFKWWIIRWRLVQQCFTQKNLVLYIVYIYTYVKS